MLAVAVAAAGDVHVVIDAADGDGGGDGGVVKLHTVSLFHQVIWSLDFDLSDKNIENNYLNIFVLKILPDSIYFLAFGICRTHDLPIWVQNAKK